MPSYGGYGYYPITKPELHVRPAVYYVYNHKTDVDNALVISHGYRVSQGGSIAFTLCAASRRRLLFVIPIGPPCILRTLLNVSRSAFPPQD